MKFIKLAMLMTALVAPARAQSYVEGNAQDAFCEWSFKKQSGKEKCRITAMGIIAMGDEVFQFTVDGMTISLLKTEKGKKTAKIGDWTGTYTSTFKMIGKDLAEETIKLSNGYTVKVVY